jgi:hypothetical protein
MHIFSLAQKVEKNGGKLALAVELVPFLMLQMITLS